MKNRITLSSPFTGANLTCRCGRVLYWEDIGTDYRAVCCRVYFERKRQEEAQ